MTGVITIPGAPLWKPEELEWLGRCPSCTLAPRYLRHASAEDRLFGTGTANWQIWSCMNCKCTYLDPRPKAEVIDRAYQTYFTHNDPLQLHRADNGSSFAWRLVNGYLNGRFGMDRTPRSKLGRFIVPLIPGLKLKLDYFAHHLPKPKPDMACLDVGCGNGLFLLRAKSAGWIVKGIDFDEAAISQARAAGIDAERLSVADHLLNYRAHYAAVTLSHVLEHTHDPEGFLLSCRELLSPGGLLWIATPNVASLGHRCFGARWYNLDVPRHLILFNPAALRDLVSKCGFSDVQLHRRGSHAALVIGESFRDTETLDSKSQKLPFKWNLLRALDDICATIVPGAGEEIVLTARRF